MIAHIHWIDVTDDINGGCSSNVGYIQKAGQTLNLNPGTGPLTNGCLHEIVGDNKSFNNI